MGLGAPPTGQCSNLATGTIPSNCWNTYGSPLGINPVIVAKYEWRCTCNLEIAAFTSSSGFINPETGGSVTFSFTVDQPYDSAVIAIDGQTISGTSWDGRLNGRFAEPGTHTAVLTVTKGDCVVTASKPVRVERINGCRFLVTVGSLANVASGELTDRLALFTVPTSGPLLALSLHYNSLDASAGPLGRGWSHSFEQSLRINAFGEAIVRLGDGSYKLYVPNSSGGYTAQAGDLALLSRNPDNSFTRTRRDGTREEYAASGEILAIVDRNGNGLTFVHAGGHPQTVRDSAGRSIAFAYDSNGLLTSITDPAGLVYGLAVDETLASVTLPDGGTWRYGYDSDAFLVVKTDPLGSLTTYSYDDQQRVVSSIDPEERSRSIAYTSSDETVRTTTFVEKDGAEWSYTFDTAAGDLLTKADPLGNLTTYTYDVDHNQLSKTDPSGTTTATYDDAGNLLTSTDVSGQTTRYEYNAYGQVTSITAPDGGVTRTEYDERGNPIATTDPSGATTRYAYDSQGRTISITAPDGGVTRMTYDAAGNLNSVTDPGGATHRMEYDASGRMSQQIDPQGGVTTFAYDARGNLIKTVDPLGNVTTAAFDANGRRISTTDANGNVTRYEYNAQGQVIKTLDALGYATVYAYGGSGCPSCGGGNGEKLTSLTDANGQTTTFAYDPLERLTSETDPLGNVTSYTYDTKRHLAAKTDANGNTIRYTYDALGRLTRKVYPDNTEESYSYDAKGNLLTAANPAASYAYTYDVAGRMTSVTDGSGRMLQYDYDGAGRKTRLTAPDGKVLRYEYDAAGRLSDLRNGGNFAFAYDGSGRRAAVTYPNGIVAGYSYDNGGRLTGLVHRSASGKVVAQSAYTLDRTGNRLSKTTAEETIGYAYDAIYRLTAADRLREPGDDDHGDNHERDDDRDGRDQDRESERHDDRDDEHHHADETYRYDPLGNRLSGPQASRHPADAVYDAANRLREDRHYRYAYDKNGNLIARTGKDDDDEDDAPASWRYRYDYENRLIEAIKTDRDDPVTVAYAYDPLGRRVEKRVTEKDEGRLKTKITRYLYDNEDILIEYDEKGKIGNRYIHGPGIDEPLALVQGKETYFYHADGLGSIVALTDKAGKVVQDYWYDSFGNLNDQKNRIKQPYTYTGREWDKETGLYYYNARYYDPMEGRFISKDPIGIRGGINLYSYVQNNPVNFTDPTGLVKWSGSFTGAAGINGIGAGFFYFDLTSECINNRRVRIKGVASTVAVGAGIKWTGTTSQVSFHDNYSTPNPNAANGFAGVISVGAAAGGEGAGGLGYAFSSVKLGALVSDWSGGKTTGLDLSAGVYLGSSMVTSSQVLNCCGE